MSDRLTVALCQINPTVGDLGGNADLIEATVSEAFGSGAGIAVLPELALTGYPPEDLLLNGRFLDDANATLASLATRLGGGVALIGTVEHSEGRLYNSVAIVSDGRVQGYARKVRLPNYGVFDEQRYFTAATEGALISVGGHPIGVSICEDIWFPGGPCAQTARSGAQLLINCSASPFHRGKGAERLGMLESRTRELGLPIAWCGMVGGQDELVFDGDSVVVDQNGAVLARAAQFEPETLVVEIDLGEPAVEASALPEPGPNEAPIVEPFISVGNGAEVSGRSGAVAPRQVRDEGERLSPVAEVEAALVLGLRDYVSKNGFDGVVLGVSGGIDSAVVASIAVDAVGSDCVHGVVMPSPWSSSETQADARRLCGSLGIAHTELAIGPAMDAFADLLVDAPQGGGRGLADENIQARIRGNLLMYLSNSNGWLVITTGNKSELAVGYSTLYGDAAGGFGVLKDVPKGLVYELARLRNERADSPIPESIIERAPSAELRPGQTDQDSLPPYEVLDEILALYVEERLDLEAIASRGFEPDTVDRIIRLVDRAEYKRRQYPPGVKISQLAFGRDRRMPMTNRWRS